MAKQWTIKEISRAAGVSPGTVDRVLHNRGSVSDDKKIRVEEILSKVGYKYNLHTSAISLKKEFRIVVCIPSCAKGEYWQFIRNGIEHALVEYSDIKISCSFSTYNQFDVYSCRNAQDDILENLPDAVILGPTFEDETRDFCRQLDEKNIPYVFVDSTIEGTRAVGAFTTDQPAGGLLMAKLLSGMLPEGSEVAIFRAKRIGNQESHNSEERQKGFYSHLRDSGLNIKEGHFSMFNVGENKSELLRFISRNPRVRGIAVMNSRGHIIADILSENGISDIKVAAFDLTDNNRRCLKNGSIAFLLCQRPEMQGFSAVKAAISYLLYKNAGDSPTAMPIDIVMKENLDFYKDFI